MRNKTRTQRGFTIVELSIVMMFISLLMLGVVFVTIYAGKAYAKGITLKTLNQVGREVTDAIRRDVASAPNPSAVMFVTGGQTGRLCTGTVSYVWNGATLLASGSPSAIKDSGSNRIVRLARVDDSDMKYCQGLTGTLATDLNGAKWTEVLQDSIGDFAVYDMSMERFSPAGGGGQNQALYHIALTFGTNEAGTTEGSGSATTCKPPTDNAANFDYCSVRSFDMVIRSGGGAQ